MEQLPKYVVDAIWKGRAVLIAGQDLARGETQGLLGSDNSLPSLRAALAQPSSSLLERVASLRVSAPDSAHVEIAQAPWALVFSSGVDTRLASALEAAAPAARRVRRRFVNELDADNLLRSPTVLEVMHLSLVSDFASPDGAVPEPRQWSRATRLIQPRILDRVRDVVGPAHIVIVDGVTGADALDRDDLVAAFDGLDDAQIILCDTNRDDTAWLRNTRPGALVLHGVLADLLQFARAETPLPVPELLRAEDFAITARAEESAERRTAVFRADEIRDIRRHLEIVGDAPGLPAPTERDERLRGFRTFLRTPRLRPDYQSFVAEFCLERRAYGRLYDTVMQRIGRIRGTRTARDQSTGPIILAGFPGSGRTTGLHWLGVRLRQEGWPVVHLAEATDEPDLFAIEQVIRLTEQRLKESGAAALVVLLADGVGRDGAKRLDDRLRRAGRRTVVVAIAVPHSGHYETDEETISGTEILLDYQLESKELQALNGLLRKVGIEISADVLRSQAGVEGFLGMLDRLDPGAREGLAQVLRQEFDRFVPDLARALTPREHGAIRGSLGDALAEAFARARTALPGGAEAGQSPPSGQQLDQARDFLRTVFALAWLDRPAPLDLLGRRFPALFLSYDEVRVVALAHGFLTEIPLDVDGTPALAAINPGIARVLRRYVVGYPRNVLDELRALVGVIPWPSGGDTVGLAIWPKFVFELLRSISPRGPFGDEFGSADDVRRLLDILRELRESTAYGYHRL